MTEILQSIFSGLAIGALFCAVGVGFVIIHRVTGIVNFTQGVITALGAYVMSIVSPLPWVAGIFLSGLVASAASAVVGIIVLSMRAHFEYAPIMVTLGLALLGQGIFVATWGNIPISYKPISGHAVHFAGAYILPQQILLLLIVIILFILMQVLFTMTYIGKALSAAAMNPQAAQLVGVGLMSAGMAAFIVAGMIGGVSGAVAGAVLPVTPSIQLELAIGGFAAAIVGDLSRPLVTFVAGIILGILTSLTATYGFPQYQQVVAMSALFVVLVGRTVWSRRGGALA